MILDVQLGFIHRTWPYVLVLFRLSAVDNLSSAIAILLFY
jgi:hypothetical protein